MIDPKELLENEILDDIYNYKLDTWHKIKGFYDYRNDTEKLAYIQERKEDLEIYINYLFEWLKFEPKKERERSASNEPDFKDLTIFAKKI